jgi:putative oxidoreductase
VSTVSRYLLGLLFTVFGANGFLHFIQQPPPSTAYAVQFFTAVIGSHFMTLIFLIQLIAGVLLLVNRFVPLSLVVLAGVIVNILNFHITMDPGGIVPGVIATFLWFSAVLPYRSNFHFLFTPTLKSTAVTPTASFDQAGVLVAEPRI